MTTRILAMLLSLAAFATLTLATCAAHAYEGPAGCDRAEPAPSGDAVDQFLAGYWLAVDSDCYAPHDDATDAYAEGFEAGCRDIDGPGYSDDMDDGDRAGR